MLALNVVKPIEQIKLTKQYTNLQFKQQKQIVNGCFQKSLQGALFNLLELCFIYSVIYSVIYIVFGFSNISYAYDQYYVDREQGWFWYKHNEEEQEIAPKDSHIKASVVTGKENKEKNKDEQDNQNNKGDSLYVTGADGRLKAANLKVLIPQALEKALDDPTSANVQEYFLLQKMAMDKSESFMETAALIPLIDPKLDELPRRNYSPQVYVEESSKQQLAKTRLYQTMAKSIGIVFIYKGKCPYCQSALKLLRDLQEYGFKILGVSVDGLLLSDEVFSNNIVDYQAAEEMGVLSVPTFIAISLEDSTKRVAISTTLLHKTDFMKRLELIEKIFTDSE